MIRRELTAELVNRIANHPEVAPHISYTDQPMEWSEVCAKCLVFSDGIGIVGAFEKLSLDTWQCHFFALPNRRGKQAIEAAQHMVAAARETVPRIVAEVKRSNKPMMWFARHLGMKPVECTTDVAGNAVELFEMRLQ